MQRGAWHEMGRGYTLELVGENLYLDSDPVESLMTQLTLGAVQTCKNCRLDNRRVDTL